MYRATSAFNIKLVVPSISILVLLTLVMLVRMGWYGRARMAVERYLWNEEHAGWFLVGLLLLSVFGFGVLAGYALLQAWW